MRRLLGLLLALVMAAPAGAVTTGRLSVTRAGPSGPQVQSVAAPSLTLTTGLGAPLTFAQSLLAPALSPGPQAVLAPVTAVQPAQAPVPASALELAGQVLETSVPAPQASSEQGAWSASSVFDNAGSVSPSDAPAGPADAAIEASFASAFDKVFRENPEVESALSSRIAASAYGRSGRSAAWKTELRRIFAPMLVVRGRGQGYTGAQFSSYLASDAPQAAAERKALADFLATHTQHSAEDWTYIYRDYPLWKEPLARYLDKLVSERRESKVLSMQSVGTGYGSEAFSLAIEAEAALKRAGEDPSAWRVRIRTYDISLMSLLTAGQGLYDLGKKDAKVFADLGLAAHFEKEPSGLLRLKGPMRGWIEPGFADLNDVGQQALVTEGKTDVVFANYLLFHMRSAPAAKLASHWLAGQWSPHGFLSMAGTVVGEVGESKSAPIDLKGKDFLGLYDGNVGTKGRLYYSDSFDARGSFAWRNIWRRLTLRGAKAVRASAEAFEAELRADPYFQGKTDGPVVERLRALASELGIHIVMTTGNVLAHYDSAGRTLNLNLGWLFEAPGRKDLLEKLLAEELSGVTPSEPGSIIAVGGSGALLSVGERLSWLSERFTALSIAYYSDNAAKLLDPEETKRRAEASAKLPGGMPRGVKGFN